MDGSVFNTLFLQHMDNADFFMDPVAEEAVIEAEVAGPWSVQKTQDGKWEVVAEGRGPIAVLDGYETALLVAAAVPSLGRQLFAAQKDESPDSFGYVLYDAAGSAIGRFSSGLDLETFLAHLNVLDYLRRSPLDLARLMISAKGAALQRAGSILFIWEQAAR